MRCERRSSCRHIGERPPASRRIQAPVSLRLLNPRSHRFRIGGRPHRVLGSVLRLQRCLASIGRTSSVRVGHGDVPSAVRAAAQRPWNRYRTSRPQGAKPEPKSSAASPNPPHRNPDTASPAVQCLGGFSIPQAPPANDPSAARSRPTTDPRATPSATSRQAPGTRLGSVLLMAPSDSLLTRLANGERLSRVGLSDRSLPVARRP